MNDTCIPSNFTTSSLISIQDDLADPIVNLSWNRKNGVQIISVKQEDKLPSDRIDYFCSIFDYSSTIQARIEFLSKKKQVREFGPVKLDPALLLEAELQKKISKGFKIKILSPTSQQIGSATLRIVLSPGRIINLHLYFRQSIYPIFISYNRQWSRNQQFFQLQNDKVIDIKLGESQIKLRKVLGQETLKIECQSKFKRDLLIFLCLQQIKQIQYQAQNIGQVSLCKQSTISNAFDQLFSDKDQSSFVKSPQISNQIITDIGNVLYTPCCQQKKSDFFREKAFTDFKNFLNDDDQIQEEEELQQNLPPPKQEKIIAFQDSPKYQKSTMNKSRQSSFATLSFSPSLVKSFTNNKNSFGSREKIYKKAQQTIAGKDQSQPFSLSIQASPVKKKLQLVQVQSAKKMPNFFKQKSSIICQKRKISPLMLTGKNFDKDSESQSQSLYRIKNIKSFRSFQIQKNSPSKQSYATEKRLVKVNQNELKLQYLIGKNPENKPITGKLKKTQLSFTDPKRTNLRRRTETFSETPEVKYWSPNKETSSRLVTFSFNRRL